MKTEKYKGRKVVLNDEQEKTLIEKTKDDRYMLKFISYVIIGGWLVSGYFLNGLNEKGKAKADLLANSPQEYREFLNAEKSLSIFRKNLMNHNHRHNHRNLDEFVTPENVEELSKNLPYGYYSKLIELVGKDRKIHAGLEKIYSDLENEFNKKKEPIKENVDRLSLSFLEFLSFSIGASTTIVGLVFEGAASSSYRRTRREFLENVLEEQSGGISR